MHFLARFPMFCALLNVFIISFSTRVRDGYISDLVSKWGVCFGVREIWYLIFRDVIDDIWIFVENLIIPGVGSLRHGHESNKGGGGGRGLRTGLVKKDNPSKLVFSNWFQTDLRLINCICELRQIMTRYGQYLCLLSVYDPLKDHKYYLSTMFFYQSYILYISSMWFLYVCICAWISALLLINSYICKYYTYTDE